MNAPSGTVTFLFTDVEGSTRLWEESSDHMRLALERHDALVREAIEHHGGYVFATGGDGFAAAFATAGSAAAAALDAQIRLTSEPWDDRAPLSVRMGIHTGEAAERNGDYFGAAVNRAARLMALAHGGQVVASRATQEILSTEFEVLDLGDHQLRDLMQPEHVFQLCHPSLSPVFPPLRSLYAFPSNLPVQATDFIGRDDEMRAIKKALSESRLVTLTGVGGVGKTRLALQVAADMLPHFRDGAWLVELGGVSDEGAAEEAIATALGVQQQAGQPLRASLLSFVGNKQMLMVLDNCEHLLDVVAVLVDAIVSNAPDLVVLATSREALRILGEQVLAIPSLALPELSTALDALAGSDAVRLFIDRARAGRPGFSLGPDNATAIAQLCRRLDGVPLAIELAAARARSMAPDEIASRLDQRFRLLTGGARSAANRHQTLRRAIDWSYDLLEDEEKTLFSRLSVCAGGFNLGTAEAIGAMGTIDAIDADDILGRLVDKSLISAQDLGTTTRYRMLETVREYALERLEASGEIEDVRSAHAAHFASFAADACAGLKGAEERAWLERVEEELDNLRAAVTWSLGSGTPGAALQCILSLGLQGLRVQPTVSAWARAAVATPEAEGHPAYPAALAVLAWAMSHEGQSEEAARLAQSALDGVTGGPTDLHVVCRVASPVAGLNPILGRPPGPEVTIWLAAAQDLGDQYEMALARVMLAVRQQATGDNAAAVTTAEQALAQARRCGSPTAIAYAAFNLANYLVASDPGTAAALNAESLSCAETAGNDYAASHARSAQGNVLIRTGDYVAAMAAWLDAARGVAREGRRDLQALNLLTVSACLAMIGNEEAGAVVRGWVGTVIEYPDAGVRLNINLTEEMRNAFLRIPISLGNRYAELSERGSAMGDTEIIEYAAGLVSGSHETDRTDTTP